MTIFIFPTYMSLTAGLAFRARFPAREKLVDFLRGNYHRDCSSSPHECTNAKPETHEATKSVVCEKEDIIFALAPGATHIAAACGSRFVISATLMHTGTSISDVSLCTADVRKAGASERISAVCWVGYRARPCGNLENSSEHGSRGSDRDDLFVVVGTSMGNVSFYTPEARLMFSQSFAHVSPEVGSSTLCHATPVRALHHRISRISHSRADATEDLIIVFDDMVVRIDAVELRSATQRAFFTGPSLSRVEEKPLKHQAIKKAECVDAPNGYSLTLANDIAPNYESLFFNSSLWAVTRWGLSKVAPLADAFCIGKLQVEFAQSALDAGARQKRSTLYRATGIIAAGRGIHDGQDKVIAFMATRVAQENTLEAVTTFASKAASSAMSAMTNMVDGALHFAGAMSNNISISCLLPKGEAINSVPKMRFEGVSANAHSSSGHTCEDEQENLYSLAGYSLDSYCALIDSTRRVQKIIPAPRGSIFATIDTLGRVAVWDAAVPTMITTTLSLKGRRHAEIAWLEVPPPPKCTAQMALGRLYIVIRSPHRNKGTVELWEVGGEHAGMVSAVYKNGCSWNGPVDLRASTLLQATCPFEACITPRDSSNPAMYFEGSSRCYIFARNGDLYEIFA